MKPTIKKCFTIAECELDIKISNGDFEMDKSQIDENEMR